MESILPRVIKSVQDSVLAYCKYIAPNDTKLTRSHQAGFYLANKAWPLFFDKPAPKGANSKFALRIKWQDSFTTDSCITFYGEAKDEYRLTRFQRDFPFREPDNVGDLLVLAKHDDDEFEGFVLSTDDDIDGFLDTFGISSQQTNDLIHKGDIVAEEDSLEDLIDKFIKAQGSDFPNGYTIANEARQIYDKIHNVDLKSISNSPDAILLSWLDMEYALFKRIESLTYTSTIRKPFSTVDALIEFANKILNRRKSRAGHSLEHQLHEMFRRSKLKFDAQVVTEGKRKPDFIFPGKIEYHNSKFPEDKLIFLASKRTCKDRWRQVLNEAKRIPKKHLFTLQQGISPSQLKEMKEENVKLVVPKMYIEKFPQAYQSGILSLRQFINEVESTQKMPFPISY